MEIIWLLSRFPHTASIVSIAVWIIAGFQLDMCCCSDTGYVLPALNYIGHII